MIGAAIWGFMLGLSLGFIVCNHLNRKLRMEVDLLLESIRRRRGCTLACSEGHTYTWPCEQAIYEASPNAAKQAE